MINKDDSVGFDKVEDIGGAIQPGESLKFVIDLDEKGEKTTKLKFRDKLYDYDKEIPIISTFEAYGHHYPRGACSHH